MEIEHEVSLRVVGIIQCVGDVPPLSPFTFTPISSFPHRLVVKAPASISPAVSSRHTRTDAHGLLLACRRGRTSEQHVSIVPPHVSAGLGLGGTPARGLASLFWLVPSPRARPLNCDLPRAQSRFDDHTSENTRLPLRALMSRTQPSPSGIRTARHTLAPCWPCSKRSTFFICARLRWVALSSVEKVSVFSTHQPDFPHTLDGVAKARLSSAVGWHRDSQALRRRFAGAFQLV
jgi:hypothetical protein